MNRFLAHTGATYPIMQAPMGWIARSQLASAVSNAGGLGDGRGMAAAFALGAEGIQMGTRFVSSAESPVHANYKRAIVDADDTGTVMLNRKSSPCVRALRTERAKEIDRHGSFDRSIFKSVKDVY